MTRNNTREHSIFTFDKNQMKGELLSKISSLDLLLSECVAATDLKKVAAKFPLKTLVVANFM